MPPASTYRLQVRAAFTLFDVVSILDYLTDLGVGAVYLSPLLRALSGSEHGYDVVDFTTIDPARGGDPGWARLVTEVRRRPLQIVVDIVPNHAGVAEPSQNAAWWDVLRLGRDSHYAGWFDIDWTCGRIRLPVLGDDRDALAALRVVDGELRYYDHRFPIAPGTGPGPGENAGAVHDRQHYELVSWRRADEDQSYRRFFAVTSLAGLRVEDPAVFDATHQEIVRWVRDDGVSGLRVDHPDGLADPTGYLRRLRAAVPHAWLTVEKILEPGERLPRAWPVDGTTGYDALAEVGGVFVDPAGEEPLDRIYRELTGDERPFADHAAEGKRLVATTILRAEVNRLARLVPDMSRAPDALTELLVAMPVYRSYLPIGAEYLGEAITCAKRRRPDLAAVITTLAGRLRDPADELSRRFQQVSGAVMAKGVEDTAYYRYARFIALNEVGGDPARFGLGRDEFHAAAQRRLADWPAGMTTLMTHDTKRGEDVRARLAVLAELPTEWATLARQLHRLVAVPNRAFGYLLWQTVVGAGLISRERLHAYAEKAMREASDGTGWTDPVASFEAAVHTAVDACYDDPGVNASIADFVSRIEPFGWSNALGQKVVALTMPGVPDVYQGTEWWDDSLVDPDNRRGVDFGARRSMLRALDAAGQPPPVDRTGAAKLWATSRTLRLRRDRPELFADYRPVPVHGRAAGHALAFDRGGAVTVATIRPVGLQRSGGWDDTTLDLEHELEDALTARRHAGRVALADLLARYPVAVLVPPR
jgi:(1->4)-alpha-D-glucan 1-alpha-D-glucosylmutase